MGPDGLNTDAAGAFAALAAATAAEALAEITEVTEVETFDEGALLAMGTGAGGIGIFVAVVALLGSAVDVGCGGAVDGLSLR